MTVEDKNMELMKTLDDAWNSQDWDIFKVRHADNVAVFWPGQADPTRGVNNHHEESVAFFKWINNYGSLIQKQKHLENIKANVSNVEQLINYI